MKTTSKSLSLLLGAALLFSACGQDVQNPSAELATLSMYEFAHQQHLKASGPVTPSANKPDRSITDLLADCESQLDRIRNSFSASIGQPHQVTFPR